MSAYKSMTKTITIAVLAASLFLPASPVTTAAGAVTPGTQPRDMKLLVIGTDGTEPSFQAITSFLNYLGIPYQTLLAKTQPLPPLSTPAKGLFQGIILSTGGLSVYDTTWHSALSDADWAALDTYTRDYRVRMVAWYAWPEKRYGLAPVGALSTETTPQLAQFTSAAASVFPYLNTANPVKIANAYTYLAAAAADPGETVTPLLTVQGNPVAVIDTKSDGREYMALTMDSNPYLMHSLTLNYGIFNWVTKGVFVGSRKIYFTPQMDDFFLPNDLFVQGITACMPGGFTIDPTYDPADRCPTARMSSGDLDTLVSWQDSLNAQTQFKNFRIGFAFNGYGSGYGGGDYSRNDALTRNTLLRKGKFSWVSHTFDHEDLDCYNPAPNSGVCRAATQSEALSEIRQNLSVSLQLGLTLDSTSMVTPGISGLYNKGFLTAAKQSGIKYLVGDTSRADGNPAQPNTGIRSTIEPTILVIPRRPVNVFYNTSSGLPQASGSLVAEYNYFYGPNGIFRLANNAPFFPVTQTLADIVNRESDNLLAYMLRYEIYPNMWHQSNFVRYSGSNMLFTDVVGATMSKFAKISNLPVISMQQSDIGKYMEDRMAFNAAQVAATLTPGLNITLTAKSAANVPLTGICQQNCETYGTQKLSKVPVGAGATITIPAF